MARVNTKELHERATDMLVKALQMDSNNRIAFVEECLRTTELKDTDIKRVHEMVRKACECRDKLAIGLYDTSWADPRQFTMDFGDGDWRPEQFE